MPNTTTTHTASTFANSIDSSAPSSTSATSRRRCAAGNSWWLRAGISMRKQMSSRSGSTPPTAATASEQREIDAAIAHVRARIRIAGEYRVAVRPPPGSEYEKAHKDSRGNDPGPLAELLLTSSDFHLMTLATALSTRELYPLGGYTLLRGAAEPA